jgi:hypothetical protein
MLAMHLCKMGMKGRGEECRPGPTHVMYRPACLQDGRLSCEEFMLAMHLCEMGMKGEPLPAQLPLKLVPPSLRYGDPEDQGSP